MPKTFEQFKTKLGQLAYPELKKIWEVERRAKDESKASAKPILYVLIYLFINICNECGTKFMIFSYCT